MNMITRLYSMWSWHPQPYFRTKPITASLRAGKLFIVLLPFLTSLSAACVPGHFWKWGTCLGEPSVYFGIVSLPSQVLYVADQWCSRFCPPLPAPTPMNGAGPVHRMDRISCHPPPGWDQVLCCPVCSTRSGLQARGMSTFVSDNQCVN